MLKDIGIWRIVVGAILGISIGLGGWTLNAVANMPKEYTTKQELRELREENRDDHKELLREIRLLRRQRG